MAAHQAPRPWDSPGKNTGVGCHFLLQCMKVKSESEVAQSCPTLSNPMDCSLPGSSIHGIFQAKVLEWGAIAFSNGVPGLPLIADSQIQTPSSSHSGLFNTCFSKTTWGLCLFQPRKKEKELGVLSVEIAWTVSHSIGWNSSDGHNELRERLGNTVPMCVKEEEEMGLVIVVVASGAFRIWGKFVSLLLDLEPAWTVQTRHHPRSTLIT